MDSITIPTDETIGGHLAEVKQVSVGADDNTSAVNELLSAGWRLLHIGHAGERTIFILGKPPAQARRPTGFLS
jgi:hypothetical protein